MLLQSCKIWSSSVLLLDIQMNMLLHMQVQLPGSVLSLVGELEPFFWTRWPAMGLRPDW